MKRLGSSVLFTFNPKKPRDYSLAKFTGIHVSCQDWYWRHVYLHVVTVMAVWYIVPSYIVRYGVFAAASSWWYPSVYICMCTAGQDRQQGQCLGWPPAIWGLLRVPNNRSLNKERDSCYITIHYIDELISTIPCPPVISPFGLPCIILSRAFK